MTIAPGSIRRFVILPIALAVVGLSACDGGSDPAQPQPPAAPTPVPPPPVPPPLVGVLLTGADDRPALTAIVDYSDGAAVSDSELSPDAAGNPVARTVFEIALAPGATVGQVNALLQSIGARIVDMVAGVPFLIVRISDPGTVAGLNSVITRVRADPAVRFVNRGHLPGTDQLPGNVTLIEADLKQTDHHIAIRADRAWNARGALSTLLAGQPTTIVADFFGDGAGDADFDFDLVDGAFGSGRPNQHGYHVLGIISGRFGGAATARGQVTGMFPARVRLGVIDGVVDATAERPFSMIENAILRLVRDAPGKSVVSTSLNDCASGMCDPSDPATEYSRQRALTWIEKVRTAALEERFLHLTSSGNIHPATPDKTAAERNSPFAAAALAANIERTLPDLSTERVANLSNTLVIDNVRHAPETPFGPLCLSNISKFPGNLAAIGSDVHSFLGASLGADNKSGTSMSTPQVAGLAAYVWTLNPGLSPQNLLQLLQDTASASVRSDLAFAGCSPAASAPVVDAYAAVLAADRATALAAPGAQADAPARLALLDVADGAGNAADADGTPEGNRAFDEHDIQRFRDEFFSQDSRTATSPGYSRYDLNGDGWVSGFDHRAVPFNLDIDYPPTYATTTLEALGDRRSLDESRVTDMQVLCYYAYSTLYTGSVTDRDWWLQQFCAPLVLTTGTQARADFLVSVSDPRRCGVTSRPAAPSRPPLTLSASCPTGNAVTFTVAQESRWRLNWDVSAVSGYNSDAVPSAYAELEAAYNVDEPGTLRITLQRAWGTLTSPHSAPGGVSVGHVSVSVGPGEVVTYPLTDNKPAEPLVYELPIATPTSVRVTIRMRLQQFPFGSSFAGNGRLASIEFVPSAPPR